MRLRTTHVDFASLCIKLAPKKDQIQAQLDNGKTIVEFATQHKVSPGTMRQIFQTIDVKLARGGARNVIQGLHTNVCIVLARVAEKAGVNYDEIKPYLG